MISAIGRALSTAGPVGHIFVALLLCRFSLSSVQKVHGSLIVCIPIAALRLTERAWYLVYSRSYTPCPNLLVLLR